MNCTSVLSISLEIRGKYSMHCFDVLFCCLHSNELYYHRINHSISDLCQRIERFANTNQKKNHPIGNGNYLRSLLSNVYTIRMDVITLLLSICLHCLRLYVCMWILPINGHNILIVSHCDYSMYVCAPADLYTIRSTITITLQTMHQSLHYSIPFSKHGLSHSYLYVLYGV